MAALILVFFPVGVLSAVDGPFLMKHSIPGSRAAVLLPTHPLGSVTSFLLIRAGTAHMPVEAPAGTAESSIISGSRLRDYSGRDHALVKCGSRMMSTTLSCVVTKASVLSWDLGSTGSLPQRWLVPPMARLANLGRCATASG